MCFRRIASTGVRNIVLSSLSRGILFPRMIISQESRSYRCESICLLAGTGFPSYGNNISVLEAVVLIGESILYPSRINRSLSINLSFVVPLFRYRYTTRYRIHSPCVEQIDKCIEV